MNINFKLEKGKVLIIRGGQDSGKTALARRIADDNGVCSIITQECITNNESGINDHLICKPNTLIFDDVTLNHRSILGFKSMISNENITVNVKGRSPFQVKTPNIIITTGDREPLRLGEDERRYVTIDL